MNNATNRRVGKLAEYGLTPAVRYETGVLLWTAAETDKLLALLRKLQPTEAGDATGKDR